VADLPSVDAYLEGKDPEGGELFRRFADLVGRCGPSEPRPRSSIVYSARERIFVGAWIERRRPS
jgi:hypothetical protein